MSMSACVCMCVLAILILGKVLSLGTAFAGMETVTFSLKQLGLAGKFDHRFSIENEPSCIRFIRKNCKVKAMYKDITKVRSSQLETSDVYVAGFPCQPFSLAGLRQGRHDAKGRGSMFRYCKQYISNHKPRTFILENVASLKTASKFAGFYKSMMRSLRNVGDKGYHIFESCLNTKDHGTPHHRNRLYIVGIRKDSYDEKRPFRFPKPTCTLPLRGILDSDDGACRGTPCSATGKANLARALSAINGVDLKRNIVVADVMQGLKRKILIRKSVFPCITKARGGAGGFWIVNYGRMTNIEELLRLQGFQPSELNYTCVSARQMGMMAVRTKSTFGNYIYM
jgi:DNA (cytosine-5)-methyltransferase 1